MYRLLILSLLAILLPGLAVVPVQGAQPKPVITLTPGLFELESQSIVLGTLTKVEISNEAVFHRIRAAVTIDVERTLFGPDLKLQELVVKKVWYLPSDFPDNGERGDPRVGDRVFFRYEPNYKADRPELFGDMRIGQAAAAEIARIDRVKRLMAMPDTEQAARLAVEGCRDDDLTFAIWCLSLLRSPTKQGDGTEQRVYGEIRRHVSAAEYEALLWELLSDPATADDVYEYVDRALAQGKLTDEEQQTRSRRHLRRIAEILSRPDEVQTGAFDDKLKYMIRDSYPSMPVSVKLEALDALQRLMTQGKPHPECSTPLRYLSRWYDPSRDDEAMFVALSEFYRGFSPLHCPALRISSYYFCSGLYDLMCRRSGKTRVPYEEGVLLLEELILLGDDESASNGALLLTGFSRFCEDKKIARFQVRDRLRSIRDTTTNVKAKAKLSAYLKKWDEDQEEPPVKQTINDAT
ncbi:hypothetical protein [Blastopirellula marina]|uniref:Uncharacterized protein n=1 Tax=Blastopirellula marina TaxID=124 RepID=A0A2S8GT39_9BACT|nr:hypothetical protein [Blastopirellula marina]PQO47585.1 hypothetical protein C5Y93_02685 [Blastopirellula marina]